MIAKQIDEWKLHAAFGHYTACCDKSERVVQRGLFRTGSENDLGYINDVVRQFAVADRIFGYELQQRWVVEVVAAFEDNAPMRQIWMLRQVGAQSTDIASIEKFDATTE